MSTPLDPKEYKKWREVEISKLREEKRQIKEQRAQIARESQEIAAMKNQAHQLPAQNTSGAGQGGTHITVPSGMIEFLREFKVNEDFEIWFEQFEEYVFANSIPAERSLFITLLGTEGYKLLRNLCVPIKPRDKSLLELVDLFKKHLNPKPNLIAERFKFKERKQKQGESISTFLAVLKQMSLYCEFGDSLNHNLRDQLVWGLRKREDPETTSGGNTIDAGKNNRAEPVAGSSREGRRRSQPVDARGCTNID